MDLIYYVFIFLLGLVFGSFYSCIAYRIPNKISTIKPSSFCPKCKRSLKWYMNIPVLSYLLLGGRCKYCKEKISILYPITELVTATMFTLSFFVYGISYNFLMAVVIESVLIVVTITDLKYYYISDRVILIGLISILILNFLASGTFIFLYKLLSALAMFTFMLLIKLMGDKMFKKESLGGGDIKLMSFIGASVGLLPSVIVIFIASVLGLIYSAVLGSKNEGILPFGPFLLFSTLVVWFINFDLYIWL